MAFPQWIVPCPLPASLPASRGDPQTSDSKCLAARVGREPLASAGLGAVGKSFIFLPPQTPRCSRAYGGAAVGLLLQGHETKLKTDHVLFPEARGRLRKDVLLARFSPGIPHSIFPCIWLCPRFKELAQPSPREGNSTVTV